MPTSYPCTFCNRTDSPRSGEDIFAKWIGKEFPDSNWTRINPDTKAIVGRSKNKPGLVSNKVCCRCNNGWMSRLEQAAKPILVPLMKGERMTLTPDEQGVVAKWFTKTIMAYDINAKRTRDSYFRLDERVALMSCLSVPDDTSIFLARYKGSAGHIITKESHLGNPDKHLPQMDGYAPTVVIKHLALQLFSFRRAKEPFLGFDIPDWRVASVQIWPVEGTINWPPLFTLDDKGLDDFASRWADIGIVLLAPPP